MPDPSNVSDIKFTQNFIENNLITAQNGIYTFSYHYLTSKSELSASTGYDVDTVDSDGAFSINFNNRLQFW
jgi:hypothetical protein